MKPDQRAGFGPEIWWPAFYVAIILPCTMSSVTMWVIGLVTACLIAALTWLATQYVQGRKSRIDNVVAGYLAARSKPTYQNGLATLLQSGAVLLWTQGELNQVFRGVMAKGGEHPNWYSGLQHSDTLAFLKWCRKNNHSISQATGVRSGVSLWQRELRAK
jgi:hypothetical protein